MYIYILYICRIYIYVSFGGIRGQSPCGPSCLSRQVLRIRHGEFAQLTWGIPLRWGTGFDHGMGSATRVLLRDKIRRY